MKYILNYLLVLFLGLIIPSCKKTTDEIPIINSLGHKVYSVSELKAIATCTNTCQKRFTADVYFIGVVIADEQTGSFYKELYLRDRYNTGGIHLALTAHSNFYIGDSVRVNLKGLDININLSTGLLEIDSLDYTKYLIKFASGAKPQPIVINLSSLSSLLTYSTYLCDLITITNVGFLPIDTNQIWADPISQTSISRTLQDCNTNQLIVRTSNYANFALQKTPRGNGTITGIATAYQGTNQLAIRNISEVNMTGSSCTIYHKKDFEDNSLTSGNWTKQSVVNVSVQWTASSFGTDKFAKISGYISGNQNSECWLISPLLNLSNSSNPVLSFRTAAKYTGHPLEVWVSTNYNSGAPSSATWFQLSGFAISSNNLGSYAWTLSGNISLSIYKSVNTRIAFKYQSTTSAASTYELDDILIKEN
jgi:hypothetical protein